MIRRTTPWSTASAKISASGSPNRIATTAEVSITISGQTPLIVAEDLVRPPAGAARQGRRPPADRHDPVLETGKCGAPLLALQPVAQGLDYDPGDRLAGACGQLARQDPGCDRRCRALTESRAGL